MLKSRSERVDNPSLVPGFFGWVTELVHAQRAKLVRLARREGLQGPEAFDVVQDAFFAFLAMPLSRKLAATPSDAAALMVVLVRNAARNRRRRHEIAVPHDSEPALIESLPEATRSIDELLARAEQQLQLLGCLDSLSGAQRAVVTMRMLDEVKGEDVAAMLKTTPGNVAVMLHRAIRSLRACLQALPH